MKKLLILFAFLAFGLTASAQELSATFVQKKTIKATHKVIPGEGTVTFSAPDQLRMTYAVPEGEYLIIDGNKLESCVKGKAITFDTAKNPRMRKMRNTLLNCITGDYEKAAEENDAALVVEQKGDVKTVSMMARKPQPTGYARITLDYNKKGLPVRMVLDEFAGIETEYTFKY
ncbi:MAG: outer membrane lipoprotein carrier protein LolA [Bacteroidales bacterium]|nr:outer membrane lipoprotein carrier protein LolA [Bacteroidales bacterium]